MKRVSKISKREKNSPKKQEVKPSKKTAIADKKSLISNYIEKYPFLVFLVLFSIISIFIFKDFLFIKKLFLFKDIGSDSINVNYPWMVMFQNMKAEQGQFGWSFYCGMGYPVFSGIQNLISPFIVTNLITEPFFNLVYGNDPAFLKFPYFLFYLFCIGVISFYYFKTIGFSNYIIIMGSLLVSYMGYTIATSSWNHYMDVFNGIFLLLAFEQLYKKNRWYFFPIAIVFLSGNFFNVYMYGFFLITYMLFRYFSENSFEIKKIGFLSLKMAGLTILGLALNAINYVSYLVNAINSPRASGEVSLLAETGQNSLLSDLGYQYSTSFLRLFSSDMAGTATNFKGWYNYLEAPLFYCGLISLLLVFHAFSYLSKKEKTAYGIFGGFWLFVILIPDLRHTIHLNLGEYYKVGINFIIPFILIFMGMNALDKLLKEDKLNKFLLFIPSVTLIALLFYPFEISGVSIVETTTRKVAVVFLIVYTVLIYLLSIKKYKLQIKIVLLIVILIELSYFSHHSINSRQIYSTREFKQNKGGYNDKTIEAVNFIKEVDKSFYRLEKDYFSGNAMHSSLNDAQAQGYFGTTLYSSFNHPYYIAFLEEVGQIKKGVESQTRWAPGLRNRPLLQTIASVKYNVSKSEQPFMLGRGYRKINQFADVVLMKNDYYIPFGFCYDAYMLKDDFSKLSTLQKDIALLKCCILTESDGFKDKNLEKLSDKDTVANFNFDVYNKLVNNRRKDTLNITSFKHDKIIGEIKTDSAKILFFSIPFDENWEVKVNGKTVEKIVANIGFIGIPIEKGNNTVILNYTPPYFYATLGTSVFATIIYLLLFLLAKEFNIKTKLIISGVLIMSYVLNYLFIL